MSGRYIGENTRLIYDILHITDKLDIPGLLLIIDFEKAFDSISWKFIEKVLNFLNFRESIKLEDLKVLRRSPVLLNNVKIGQGQLQLKMKQILFYHILGSQPFWSSAIQ